MRRALLAAIRQDGNMNLLRAVMNEEAHLHDGEQSKFELLTPAHEHLCGMTDASKRRGDSPSSHALPPMKHRPVLPMESKSSQRSQISLRELRALRNGVAACWMWASMALRSTPIMKWPPPQTSRSRITATGCFLREVAKLPRVSSRISRRI